MFIHILIGIVFWQYRTSLLLEKAETFFKHTGKLFRATLVRV